MRPGEPRVADKNVVSDVHDIAAQTGATALVTGGAGFIGSHLCDLLRRAGWNVHSVSRRPTGAATIYRHWAVDLTDAAATRTLVTSVQPDYVFHLAGHVWATTDLALVLPTFHSNLHTTVNLLHSLAGMGCRRFITTGSQIEPDARSSEAAPHLPYAASKWASSDYVRMFHELYGLPAAIARVFMVYGPQQGAQKLIPYVVGCLARGEVPQIASGSRLGDWIYVDDVAVGLARMAVAPQAAGRTIDLGSGSLVSTAQLVEKVCSLMGTAIRPDFAAISDRPAEPPRLARMDETRRVLDWSPKVSLEEGLRRTVEWCRREAGPVEKTGSKRDAAASPALQEGAP
jgi:UDP-glucose 4-epimerase